jgi:hypothetical protein
MYGFRDDVLAGPRLSGDEDGRIRLCDDRDNLQDALHLVADPHESSREVRICLPLERGLLGSEVFDGFDEGNGLSPFVKDLGKGHVHGNLLTGGVDDIGFGAKLSTGLLHFLYSATVAAQVAPEEVMAGNAEELVREETGHGFQGPVDEQHPSRSVDHHDPDGDLVEDLLQGYRKPCNPFDVQSVQQSRLLLVEPITRCLGAGRRHAHDKRPDPSRNRDGENIRAREKVCGICPSLLVHGPMSHQSIFDGGVLAPDSHDQCGLTAVILGVHIRVVFQEQVHRLQMALNRSSHER